MTFDITILVALAPGLLLAALVLAVVVSLLIRTKLVQARFNSVVLVERMKEIANDASWVGAAIGTFVGFSEKDASMHVVTVLWWFGCQALAFLLAAHSAELNKSAAIQKRRKLSATKSRPRKTI